MESSSTVRFVFFSSLFLASAAHIADFDSYWQKRADEATNQARRSYDPDPVSLTRQFNHQVDLAKQKQKGRGLRGANRMLVGLCQATNPIDRCWRCRSNWADRRRQLAECAQGFGRRAGGGKAGELYVVTDASDSDVVDPKPGTLRFGVVQDRPLWIVFARDMVIRLAEELIVTSNKTIDGRGADVRIAGGAGLTLQFVHNVILHGLRIHDIKAGNGGMVRVSESHVGRRTRSDGDGISISGSSDIWIDHVSVANCMDGLIDAEQNSTAITVSNCHLTQHNDDAMPFGESESYSGDAITQITLAFNHFGAGLVRRLPRCRWGFCHIVSNDYAHRTMEDAVGGRKNPTILGYATESENGASSVESGSPELKQEFPSKENELIGSYVSRLTRFAGALDCVADQQC
ncbi:pectate lyase-like [Zingiber officinale]|uniref:pectate lyase-like n=1 Tax=Zingiber officinale TaxID=94328 RepID=UPI001C4CC477|nr:pectate lyase-like [Zingiber officinale]